MLKLSTGAKKRAQQNAELAFLEMYSINFSIATVYAEDLLSITQPQNPIFHVQDYNCTPV